MFVLVLHYFYGKFFSYREISLLIADLQVNLVGCDIKNKYQKMYFMPFSFYYANYTACSEPNPLAFSLFSGQGPVFVI